SSSSNSAVLLQRHLSRTLSEPQQQQRPSVSFDSSVADFGTMVSGASAMMVGAGAARRGAVFLGTSNNSNSSNIPTVNPQASDEQLPLQQQQSLRLPPRPAGYGDVEYTAIKQVLQEDANDTAFADVGDDRHGGRRPAAA